MMRRVTIVLVLIFSVLEMSGQQGRGVIEGTVTDTGGNPIAAAYVVIDSLFSGVTTGNDGRYMIRGLKDGIYNLRYSFVGYDTETRAIKLVGHVVSDVVLTEAITMTDEIVVRANRAGSRTPMAYSNIENSIMRKNDMTRDMPYLLALTPSVVETSDAGNGVGYTSLRIRGTDANRINVTVDGIPLNDPESQQVFWVDLPDLASSTGNVQIQRGVGTSTNGSGAFGASMNINTLLLPASPGASVDFSAGSFSTFKATAKIWSGKIDDKFSTMIRASSISSDGYIEYSASDINSVMVSGSWETAVNKLRFNVISGRERTGISWWGVPQDSLDVHRRFNPAGVYEDNDGNIHYYADETDNYTQNHYHLFYTHKFTQKMSLNTGLHLTKGSGYYEEQKSDIDSEEYDLGSLIWAEDTITETDIIQRKWLRNDFFGIIWSLVRTGNKTEWIAGGGANRYDGDHFGKIMWMEFPGTILPGHEWYRGHGYKDELNIYGKVNSEISARFNWFIDLQYRFIGYKITGLDDDLRNISQNHYYRFFNPKTGIFWNDGKGSDAFVSVSVAHREPTRSNFTDATGDNNATPRPERLLDFESGYSFKTGTLSLSLNLYMMLYHDQLVPTGKISNTGYSVMTNVPESYRAGVELSCNYRPSSRAALQFNLTLSRNKILDFRNYYFDYNTSDWTSQYVWNDLGVVDIAYSPSVIGSGELEVNPLKNIALRLNGKYVGKQYFDNTMTNKRSISPYFVSNFIAEYEIGPKKPETINLRLQVNNIFNNLYENNAYGGMWKEDGQEKTWAYFFPQAGLNFMCGLSLIF